VKKNRIQVKIGFILIFAVIGLSSACYLLYRNLSAIVSSMQIDLNPELKLVSIRDISGDLETADNSIRIYTITRDTSDLKPYYSIIKGIDEKINQLSLECSDDTIMLNQVDTISTLIEENMVNWNELMYLIDKDNVVEFLKHLSNMLNAAPENIGKKSILKRVFARNSKNIINEQELKINLLEIEKQGKITKEKLKENESQLVSVNGKIKDKFYDLITRMENQVSILIREKGLEANQQAERTYYWFVLFAISGGLLAILGSFSIIRYIRNANALQAALEKSKNEAEDLAQTKELFMANISHELRTPVTAISGFTEQLVHEISDENVLRSLKIIKSSSDHLAKIIDDILDFSKIQNGKMILEKVHFSISQILNEVNTIFKQQASQNNTPLSFSVKSGTPPVLLGDPYRLKQILINLVGNSVKFTENGSVCFTAEGITNNSDDVDLVLEVTDTGIGIDADKLKIIFEDFTQAEMSTTRKYGGTGLGLSIVKKLVELHQGTIVCESQKNHGTKITCNLPLHKGLEDKLMMDVTLPLTIPDSIRNLKVLVVDDEEYNRLLFKKILDRWNIKNDLVVNGMDAIDILKGNRYDLLFMDIRMPGFDGLKVTRFIRDELHISEAETKVICISAASKNHDWDKYRQAGMNAFLQKPFTEEMLLKTMLSLIEKNTNALINNSFGEEKENSSGGQKIDLKNLYHISSGDEQFVKQMLVSFISTTSKGMNEMHKAVWSGEWNAVENLAHKMLPPCRHIGAMELYNLLGKIEKSASNESDKKTIEFLLEKSLREFEAVNELLNEHIAKMK
jgi:signal transduction histidine kinase/DNA-binding NarL/FixJ family response regulator